MKNLCLFLCLVLGFIGCGRHGTHYSTIIQEKVDNPKDLSGYFYLELGGEIELLQDKFDRYTASTLSTITLKNKDGSGVSFPSITITDKFLTLESTLINSIDVTFVAGHNLKTDVGNNAITGSRRVDTLFTLNSDNSISLKIEVYSANKATGGVSVFSKTVKGTR